MQRMLTMLVLLVVGCANIQARRHADELRAMRQDDEYCVAQGTHYPESAYINCRYAVQDARALQQWKSLKMAQTAANPRALTTPPPHYATNSYHSLDRERFYCWPEPQFGNTYIFCGERSSY
ncbi:MAG TPA: hypothetical protein VJS89_07255 [Gammaproteobacteria bacterium]|nr:hypothetical protein [Gammaproteobacteria bacterium]